MQSPISSVSINAKPAEIRSYRSTNNGSLTMLKDLSDGELIQRYLKGEEKAFETLMGRHYKTTYQQFLKHCRHPDNAADLTQQLWMQMVKNLENYQDDGKFPSYVMRSASNLLTDHWRRKGVKDKVFQNLNEDDQAEIVENARDPTANTEKQVETQQQIDLLTQNLIPALPCDQRLAFLIKHESEYWDDKQRLTWRHLAQLNGLDEKSAWQSFEQTRNKLLVQLNGAAQQVDTDCQAVLIFLVWTQAQRPAKNEDYTWAYFSEILNIPENTLKTRYRAALKALADGLTEAHAYE